MRTADGAADTDAPLMMKCQGDMVVVQLCVQLCFRDKCPPLLLSACSVVLCHRYMKARVIPMQEEPEAGDGVRVLV